jgi:hypothetical protein
LTLPRQARGGGDGSAARQWEAEWTCTEGEAEDGEVVQLLMMGRGDDLGEVRSARSAILRSRRRDERKRSQEAVDRTGRFQRPPLAPRFATVGSRSNGQEEKIRRGDTRWARFAPDVIYN